MKWTWILEDRKRKVALFKTNIADVDLLHMADCSINYLCYRDIIYCAN